MAVAVSHHRFTVEVYEQMIAAGVLTEGDHVELIRGEILDKMPIGDRHAACVNRLTRLLVRLLDERAIVSIQNPIRLDDSEPDSDVALLRSRDDFYAGGKPTAADVFLVVEVADTSLAFDREVKRAIYAEAGIAEYWIVDLLDDAVEVYRGPRPDGSYADRATVGRGATLAPTAFPDAAIAVAAVLGD